MGPLIMADERKFRFLAPWNESLIFWPNFKIFSFPIFCSFQGFQGFPGSSMGVPGGSRGVLGVSRGFQVSPIWFFFKSFPYLILPKFVTIIAILKILKMSNLNLLSGHVIFQIFWNFFSNLCFVVETFFEHWRNE